MQNEKKENNETIATKAIKDYPLAVKKMYPWLINALFVAIGVSALGFLSTYTLFFTLPFLVVPFFYALQLTHSYVHLKDDMDGKRFSYYFKSYFTNGMGSYRIIRTTLFSFLYAFAGSLLFALVYSYISNLNGLNVIEALNSLAQAYSSGNTQDISNLLNEEPLLSLSYWSIVVEASIFLLSFLFHTLRYGVLVYFRFSLNGANSAMVNALYKRSLHDPETKDYNKDYFLFIWPVFVLLIVFLGLGLYIGYLLSQIEVLSNFFARSSYFSSSSLIVVCGMFFSSLALIFSLPYYFQGISSLYEKYGLTFGKIFLKMTKEKVEQLKQMQKLSEDEQKQIQESLDELEKENKEFEDQINNKSDDKDN